MNGLQVFNQTGTLIIDTNESVLNVVHQGIMSYNSSDGRWYEFTYTGWPEPPTILVKPNPGEWVGGMICYRHSTNRCRVSMVAYNRPIIACTTSPNSIPIMTGDKFGIETFDANGNLTFSSNRLFPRILQIPYVSGPYGSIGSSTFIRTTNITRLTEMPWIIATDAGVSYSYPVGESVSATGFIVRVTENLQQLQVSMGDQINLQYNPNYNKIMRFPLCTVPGL